MSDVGIKKKINQDSAVILEADSDKGPIMFLAVCDGMGGLKEGEYASAVMSYELESWFECMFPDLLYGQPAMPDYEDLCQSLTAAVHRADADMKKHGAKIGAQLGTTLAGVLLTRDTWFTVNVGDSRVYKIGDSLKQLTHDQSLVQRELDLGHITPAQAKTHKQRNILLQCIGASYDIVPEFKKGTYNKDEVFMLCSDGFRHELTEEELEYILSPEKLMSEKDMYNAADLCIRLNKERNEKDNITVILAKQGKKYRS